MMNKLQFLVLILIVVLATVSCDKNKGKYPDRSVKVVEYATIKSLKSVFLTVDKYQIGDLSASGAVQKYPEQPELTNRAFIWGILNADAMFASATKDKARLVSTASLMKELAPELTLAEEGNEFDQRVKPLAKQGNWQEIDILNSGLQSTVDVKLMDANRYDLYTLSCLGAWTETTSRLARLIDKSFSPQKTGILNQQDTWNNLAYNLGLMQAAAADSTVLNTVLPLVGKLQGSMAKLDKNTFTKEQVEQIIALTEKIKAEYLQANN